MAAPGLRFWVSDFGLGFAEREKFTDWGSESKQGELLTKDGE